MIVEIQKAAVAAMAPKSNLSDESYLNSRNESSGKRQERVAECRAQITRLCRAIHDRAVTCNNRKVAMYTFCLEGYGYLIEKFYFCTDLDCSLYPYRPQSRITQRTPESVSAEPGSKNSGQGVLN